MKKNSTTTKEEKQIQEVNTAIELPQLITPSTVITNEAFGELERELLQSESLGLSPISQAVDSWVWALDDLLTATDDMSSSDQAFNVSGPEEPTSVQVEELLDWDGEETEATFWGEAHEGEDVRSWLWVVEDDDNNSNNNNNGE
ncbi:uncharacterized protein A4U43_C07F13300 [Asparagus officinalis]|uniref:Uncharacterized protein n=1 Tax=Asparagus officinalis TaxID=4686 RepID=A0A5P1EBL7_ASPOF|nr:uncharacterized protein A4U43_C07F13300 [Asparagus officinalis]